MKTFFNIGRRYIMILAGSVAYAAGIGLFLNPNSLAPGGSYGNIHNIEQIYTVCGGYIVTVYKLTNYVHWIVETGKKNDAVYNLCGGCFIFLYEYIPGI